MEAEAGTVSGCGEAARKGVHRLKIQGKRGSMDEAQLSILGTWRAMESWDEVAKGRMGHLGG